jgi:hypothetical protein
MINKMYKSLYSVCLWQIQLTNHSTEYVYDKYNLQITLKSMCMIIKLTNQYTEYVYDK